MRTATTTATEGAYELSVNYPGVARAGLDIPWQVTVKPSAVGSARS